mgnify:CR=1 FL=1
MEDAILFLGGRRDRQRGDEPSLKVTEVIPVDKAQEALTSRIILSLESTGMDERLMETLSRVLKAYPGPAPVFLKMKMPNHEVVCVRVANEFFVSPTEEFLKDLDRLFGAGHVSLQ